MNYNSAIRFEWDSIQSDACFRDRGFDFAYAAHVFFDPSSLAWKDLRYQYGENRYQWMGLIDGRVYLVVYTTRYSSIRIISARKANQREVAQYEDRSFDH